MVYQRYTVRSRKTGPFVCALIGGALAAAIMIYPMVYLLRMLVKYGLSGYGWTALIGSIGQIGTGIVSLSISLCTYNNWQAIKGCIITNGALHGVFGIMFISISIYISYALWIFFGIVSLGSGVAAFICLLFVYSEDNETAAPICYGYITAPTHLAPPNPRAAAYIVAVSYGGEPGT